MSLYYLDMLTLPARSGMALLANPLSAEATVVLCLAKCADIRWTQCQRCKPNRSLPRSLQMPWCWGFVNRLTELSRITPVLGDIRFTAEGYDRLFKRDDAALTCPSAKCLQKRVFGVALLLRWMKIILLIFFFFFLRIKNLVYFINIRWTLLQITALST